MGSRLFYTAAAVAILAAIIIGILTVGGPNTARKDMFDQRRYEDLQKLSTALHCTNWRISDPVLPEVLDLENIRAYCGGVEIQADVLVDNETGIPYTYLRTNETEYAVCAVFYDAHKAMRLNYGGYLGLGVSFNPDTGCVTGRVR